MKNQDKEKNINPVAAIATGVVIGAGVAAAGAALLQDKKNREKVKKVLIGKKSILFIEQFFFIPEGSSAGG